MSNSVKFVVIAVLVIFATCAIVLAVDVHRLMPKAAAAFAGIGTIEKSTSDLEEATYASEAQIASLADTVNDIAARLGQHEEAELAQAQKSSEEITKLLNDADVAVGHLDASAVQLGTIGATTNSAIAGIAADAHVTFGATQETLNAATADLSDPFLKAAIAQAADSTANLAVATKEAAGAAADVHQVTAYEAKQIMKPIRKSWAITLGVARVAGNFFHF
ncbi:MAG TPA: hypothetical protein VG456_10835 [Candidatus Sulfopaludibacter sp.]|nr:hypothetical protein [Candidatus Sulfopaludibacter sp.]